MNKEELIKNGAELEKISEFSDFCQNYENWKTEVLHYVSENHLHTEQYKMLLYAVHTPFESTEETLKKYRYCIKKTIISLQKEPECKKYHDDILEIVIKNFGLYLQNMFFELPGNKATLKKESLRQIVICNEYDLQHIMYAVIKTLYPSARREVYQDIGYGADRCDIWIEEEDTIIELKCTRADHTENKLFRELGEDAFFYRCSKLIFYIYDKQSIIRDINNFSKALERDKLSGGKEVKVYVEQIKKLI